MNLIEKRLDISTLKYCHWYISACGSIGNLYILLYNFSYSLNLATWVYISQSYFHLEKKILYLLSLWIPTIISYASISSNSAVKDCLYEMLNMYFE